jgi:hypothetical protein
MSKRKRNPRVVMREKMMEAKRWLGRMTSDWDVGRTIYVDPADRKPGENAWLRARLPEEYPENDALELRELVTFMNGVIRRCQEVQDIAFERIRELEEERRG